MIGVLMFVNSRGDVILSRVFRDGFSVRTTAETFRNELISTKKVDRRPINIVRDTTFVHIRFRDLYLVMASHENINCFLAIQYATRLLQLCYAYFERIDETVLKNNFVTVQDIIDETADFGYPLSTEVDTLKSYITFYGFNPVTVKKPSEASAITAKATGKTPWRQEGILYTKNEAFLDVFEDVNLLMSQDGEVLQSEVVGRVILRAFLSGMPECEIVLSDGVVSAAQIADAAARAPAAEEREMDVIATGGDGAPAVEVATAATMDVSGGPVSAPQRSSLQNVLFHSCVRLGTYDTDRTIRFIPPDTECVLMQYRYAGNVVPPMRALSSHVKQVSNTRMEVEFLLKCDFPDKNVATDIVIFVPCPSNTAIVRVTVRNGKAHYDPVKHAIEWKISKMSGGAELPFNAEIQLIASTLQESEKLWSRPPISMKFRCTEYTQSGLKVEQLKVNEPTLGYGATKWVRYITEAGHYQCRI